MTDRGLPTYADAIEWLENHWTPREIPLRLHTVASEGWGPFFTVPFQRHLDARPSDLEQSVDQRTCHHLRLSGPSAFDCPDCNGDGFYEVSSTRYRWPMWRAMDRLSAYDKVNPPRPAMPTMTGSIGTLVRHHFDGKAAARATFASTERGAWELGEPLFLLAIRRLFARYEQAPVEVGWTQKSDSQQKAEVAA